MVDSQYHGNIKYHPHSQNRQKQLESRKLAPNSTNELSLQNHEANGQYKIG